MKRIQLVAVVLLLLGATSPSLAATLIVDAGQLVGATGVDIGGVSYDVTFVKGNCIDLYDSGLPDGGCLQGDDFLFNTEPGAEVAMLALADQVVIDGPDGNFDSQPELTLGCSNFTVCVFWLPYAGSGFGGSGLLGAIEQFGNNTTVGGDSFSGFLFSRTNSDNAGSLGEVYAVFTLTPPVPALSSAGIVVLVSALVLMVLFLVGVPRRGSLRN